jgi:hypothetical protein
MLHPHEIFQKMPAETGLMLCQFLQANEKPLYKATIESLAQAKKLRPVFIERKPRAEQHRWLLDQLQRTANSGLAAHLLQVWLVGAHKGLLCEFLDGFNIPHDENGTLESLPEAPPKDAVKKVVAQLCEKHGPSLVGIYLNTFQALDEQGWPSLAELIAEEPQLQLA